MTGVTKRLLSAKIDLGLINFRQNLRDIRAFSWSTPTLVTHYREYEYNVNSVMQMV